MTTIADLIAEMRNATMIAREHGVSAADPQLIEDWANALEATTTTPTLPTFIRPTSPLLASADLIRHQRHEAEKGQLHGVGQLMTPAMEESAGREPDGGPAFPRPHTWNGLSGPEYLILRGHSGMSLRDYLAAQALIGFGSACQDGLMDPAMTGEPEQIRNTYAKAAYAIADAMLRAREERQ